MCMSSKLQTLARTDAVLPEVLPRETECICCEQAGVPIPAVSHTLLVCCSGPDSLREAGGEAQGRIQWPPQHPLMVIGKEPSYGILGTSPRVMSLGPTGGPPLLGRMSCACARREVTLIFRACKHGRAGGHNGHHQPLALQDKWYIC